MLRLILLAGLTLGAAAQQPAIVNTPSDDADAVYFDRTIRPSLLICVQDTHNNVYACTSLTDLRRDLLTRKRL